MGLRPGGVQRDTASMPSPLAATVETMRTHLTTSRHAEMLFDVLVDLLGDQGVVWTANQGQLRRLFRRDSYVPTLIVPWPLAELSVGGRIGWVSAAFDARTGVPAPEREPLPGKPSRRIRPVMPMFRRGGRSAILPAFYGGDHGENDGGAAAWGGA